MSKSESHLLHASSLNLPFFSAWFAVPAPNDRQLALPYSHCWPSLCTQLSRNWTWQADGVWVNGKVMMKGQLACLLSQVLLAVSLVWIWHIRLVLHFCHLSLPLVSCLSTLKLPIHSRRRHLSYICFDWFDSLLVKKRLNGTDVQWYNK